MKAEKFIQDYTRHCSNEMSLENKDGSKLYNAWLTPDDAKCAVEIAREEVIEKVCSFIDDNIAEYIDVRGYTGDTFIDVECDKFINDLKQAMKDE
jgi:hypothetical protein